MSCGALLEAIGAQRIIPVLRCADAPDAVATARACVRAGFRVIELTRTTPDVEQAIAELQDDNDLLLGLGTVTHRGQIMPAVRAGASFVVSFCDPEGMIQTAHAHRIAAIPGALTPSEIAARRNAGADAVKLFPAAQTSPRYVSDLLTVMPGLRLLATGGLGPHPGSILPWLAAGTWAIGLGGALGTAALDGPDEVERRARLALDAVRTAADSHRVPAP